MPDSPTCRYDVAIIGSGIAGSTLAAILARHGQRVVVFEAGQHPRFAIGESMILESSEVLRATALLYDVPELAYLSSEHYFAYVGTSHGVKRHFSFLHHEPGLDLNGAADPARMLQAVIPKEPHGHELHLFRQDADAFLLTTAIRYGAEVRQRTRVAEVELGADRVTITTDEGAQVEAAYVVDAGGVRSVLAQALGLRRHELQTHSRALFTHAVDVPCFHMVGARRRAYGLPFRVSEGTMHHVFPGGWLWAIPFGNHRRATNPLTSVGLLLDPRVHPLDSSSSPENEFQTFLARYPAMQAQMKGATAVRAWTRTPRIQFSSTQVVGDRWALLGQAAGFVDPLFSKGLYTTLFCTATLADLLLTARSTGTYTREAFQPLEDVTLGFIDRADRLIAGAYRSFADLNLWCAYAVLWLLGAYAEFVKLMMIRAQATDARGQLDRRAYFAEAHRLRLVGGGFEGVDALARDIEAIVEEGVHTGETAGATAAIRARLETVDWMPFEFRQMLHGRNHLARHKLTLNAFRIAGGPLGRGRFHDHILGTMTPSAATAFLVREKLRYAPLTLRWKRRRTMPS